MPTRKRSDQVCKGDVYISRNLHDGMTVDQLRELIADAPDDAIMHLESSSDYHYNDFRISWSRPETDEEFKKRKDYMIERQRVYDKQVRDRRKAKVANERREYLRLKAKFESKNKSA